MISQKLFDALKEKKADAIISESQQTRKWYTGISTSDGWLIIESNKEATLFVDGRYIEYAKNTSFEGSSFWELKSSTTYNLV